MPYRIIIYPFTFIVIFFVCWGGILGLIYEDIKEKITGPHYTYTSDWTEISIDSWPILILKSIGLFMWAPIGSFIFALILSTGTFSWPVLI